MDGPSSFEDLRACLQGIASVNALVRAYAPTFQWLDHVYTQLPRQARPLHIVDVGCGYGDLLRRIRSWAADRNLPVTLTGIDLNADAVRAAREVTVPGTVTYLAGDAFDFMPEGGIDLVVSSLTTHHMEDAQVVDFLRWMEATARLGWFINDLHRQPVPYHLFRLLARLMPWHPYVKHDGPVSILRSFRPADWVRLCSAAGLAADAYQIQHHRPGRLCVARLRPAPRAWAGGVPGAQSLEASPPQQGLYIDVDQKSASRDPARSAGPASVHLLPPHAVPLPLADPTLSRAPLARSNPQ